MATRAKTRHQLIMAQIQCARRRRKPMPPPAKVVPSKRRQLREKADVKGD